MKDNKLWIFIHAPRTGGTSLITYIKQSVPKEEIIVPSNIRYGFESPDFDKKKARFILGHATYYGIHQEFSGKKPIYFTFLRDPAERIVSFYNEKFKNYPGSEIVPFEKWYKSQPKNELVRFYNLKLQGSESSHIKIPKILAFFLKFIKIGYKLSNFLQSSIRKVHPYSQTNKDLENAKIFLDKCHFVAIIENSKEDSKFLFKLMGIKGVKWERSSTYRKKIIDTNEKIREMIYRDNPLDYKLYKYALELNKRIKKRYKQKSSFKKK